MAKTRTGKVHEAKPPKRPSSKKSTSRPGSPKSPTSGRRKPPPTSAASVAGGSTGSTSTAPEEKVSKHVKKALAQAIEKKPGGIEWFKKEERKNQHDLEATLNADTATFGQRGDKLRGKTGQLCHKWKLCDRSKCLERVPNGCQVLSCEEQRKRGQSGSDSDPSVSEEEESGSDGGSGIPVSKQSKPSAKKKESPPAVTTATKTESEIPADTRSEDHRSPSKLETPVRQSSIQERTSPSRTQTASEPSVVTEEANMSSEEGVNDFPTTIGESSSFLFVWLSTCL